MKSRQSSEDAFTGLEAAIVLIAFVVVAAVFSYVVLGAGFFTTQKSQETIYTGTKQASNNLATTGPIVMQATSAGDVVNNLSFTIKLASGANSIDMSKITYHVTTNATDKIYVDTNSTSTSSYDTVTRTRMLGDNTNNLLEPNEIYQVTIELVTGMSHGTVPLAVNQQVSIEIQPDIGAALLLQKRTPAGMTAYGVYEVY